MLGTQPGVHRALPRSVTTMAGGLTWVRLGKHVFIQEVPERGERRVTRRAGWQGLGAGAPAPRLLLARPQARQEGQAAWRANFMRLLNCRPPAPDALRKLPLPSQHPHQGLSLSCPRCHLRPWAPGLSAATSFLGSLLSLLLFPINQPSINQCIQNAPPSPSLLQSLSLLRGFLCSGEAGQG